MSTWIFLSAPVEPPHQLATGSNSITELGTRCVILKGPVPTYVAGFWVHFSPSASPVDSSTFWSRTRPAVGMASWLSQ